MPLDARDRAYLGDMLNHAREAVGYAAAVTPATYIGDRMLQLALERLLQIIGEAANHVSPGTRAAHPEVAWHAIIGLRHVLSHEYGDIKHEEIWKTITVSVPRLIGQLEAMTPTPPGARPSGWDIAS